MTVRCARTEPMWHPLVIDRATWDQWDGARFSTKVLVGRDPIGPHSAKIDPTRDKGYHVWMKQWPSSWGSAAQGYVEPDPGPMLLAGSGRSTCTIW